MPKCKWRNCVIDIEIREIENETKTIIDDDQYDVNLDVINVDFVTF